MNENVTQLSKKESTRIYTLFYSFFLIFFSISIYKQIAKLITNQEQILQNQNDQNELLSGVTPAGAGAAPDGTAAAIATTVANSISPLAEKSKPMRIHCRKFKRPWRPKMPQQH